MQKSSFLSQEDPFFSSLNSFCSSSCPVTVLDPNAPGHSWVDTIKNYTFQTHTFSFSPSLPFSLSLFLSPSLFHSSTLCVLCACMSICTWSCASLCTYPWRPMINIEYFSFLLSILFFEIGLPLILEFTICLDWLAKCLWGSTCLLSSSGIKNTHHHVFPGFICLL